MIGNSPGKEILAWAARGASLKGLAVEIAAAAFAVTRKATATTASWTLYQQVDAGASRVGLTAACTGARIFMNGAAQLGAQVGVAGRLVFKATHVVVVVAGIAARCAWLTWFALFAVVAATGLLIARVVVARRALA